MDPAPPPPSQTQVSNPATTPGPLKFPKLNKKNLIIILSAAILILLIPIIFLIPKKPSPQPELPKAKTWEIILSFDNNTETISLKKLSVLNQEITADFRSAQFSPYELVVLDKDDRALFRTKVNITEQIIYNILSTDATGSASIIPPPNELSTVLHIPYKPSAAKISISKYYSPVLQINITPEVAFNFVGEVFAQTSPSSCGPVQIVFISDGYSNFPQFHSDVDRIKTAFASTQPYAFSASQIFDFKTIDNTEALGCRSGIRQTSPYTSGCIQNPRIKQIGFQNFPKASKFIVLVNNPNAASVDGGILGVANDIGGDVGVFTNRTDIPPQEYTKTAIHEVLGHMVGLLYDRYVYPSVYGQSKILISSLNSNCTVNPQGEQFWKNSGSTSSYQGCTNPSAYAPFPRDCGTNGNSSTIMSAASCSASGFDSVEQAWINQQVIPLYQNACPVSPTAVQATSTPGPTIPESTPGPTSTGSNPTSTPLPTISTTLINNGNYPISKFTFPGEGRWVTTYAGITASFQAIAQAPSGKTMKTLGIYRIPANIYGTSLENWTPIATTSCNSASCNLTGQWVITEANRQTWQDWYLNIIGEDSSGVKCTGQILYPPGIENMCGGGLLAVQILEGRPPAGYVFGAYDRSVTPFTGTGSNPNPTITPGTSQASTTSKIYTCEEISGSGIAGSQVQVKTLTCK